MRKENNTPHLGMIVTLGVIIVAIWMLAIYGTIQEEQEIKYDVTVRPGAVSYGTHSSATVPMVSSPMRHAAAPMISGSAVRSYAHYGHAAYTVHHTPYTVHTTSSATVHTIGSGGGASGGGSSASGGQGTSSRGITYGGASVSVPTLALVTPVYSSAATEGQARYGVGPRRAHPIEDGHDDGEVGYDTEDPTKPWWWNQDEEEWQETPFDGAIKYEGGYMYRYEDGDWVLVGNQSDPSNTPLGDAPWHWMLLLALGYAIVRMIRTKHVFLPKVG